MKNVLLSIVVVGLLLATAPVIAATLVDQQQLINNAPHDLTHNPGLQGLVQGFTPSVNRIDGVEVYFAGFGAGPNASPLIEVEIYNCLGGSNTLPDWDAGVLGQGSRTMVFDTEPIGWKEFLLDSSVTLVPGNNYSIVMRSDSAQRIKLDRYWDGSGGDPYSGGGYAAWIIGETNATAEYVDIFEDDKLDMTFKTLYEGTAATHNPGDVNNDDFVGGADLTKIIDNWGLSPADWEDGDIHPFDAGDDFIGGADYTQVLDNWGTSYGPEAVPEPATLLVVALAGLTGFIRRR